MEWICGNIFIRPRGAQRGEIIQGHKHNFDHAHFVQAGWWLVRGFVAGEEVCYQKASIEYKRVRELMLKYEPENVLRPVRFPDIMLNGFSTFNIVFINPGDPLPEGGEEIHFAPTSYHCLVHAEVLHDMIALDDGHGDCVYSHRDPQGDVIQVYDGWTPAYDYALDNG